MAGQLIQNNMTNKRKPGNLIYGLDDTIPLPICLLLGLQHSLHVTTALIFALIVLQGMGASPTQAGFFAGLGVKSLLGSCQGNAPSAGAIKTCPAHAG